MRNLLQVARKSLPWIVMAAFLAVVIAPASFWLKVDSIRVSDSIVGSPPALDVQRTIVRDFTADWVATVRRAGAHGGFVAVCTASGKNDYIAGAVLPTNLDLDWWTDPVKCKLGPGEYILTTRWILDVPTPWDKVVSGTSNVFTVMPNMSSEIERQLGADRP